MEDQKSLITASTCVLLSLTLGLIGETLLVEILHRDLNPLVQPEQHEH